MTSLVVTAIGMTTSLGLDSVDACAAARAGLVRLSEINTLNAAIDPRFAKEALGLDGLPPFVGHLAPVVGAGYSGLAKLLALSKSALAELLFHAAIPRDQWSRVGLCVNLSDGYFQSNFGDSAEPLGDEAPASFEEEWVATVEALPSRLCADHDLPIPVDARVAIAGGRVGLVSLLQRAAAAIQRGSIDRCIVGGVESCVEPTALHAYAAAGVVKTADNPAGFLPGEAAAFLLLERPAHANRDRITLRVAGFSQTNDVPYLRSDAVPSGRGIADAVTEALAQRESAGDWPRLVVADLNGTEGRAADWGSALVQLRARFGELAFDVWLPALSFGETGAAAGPLAVCMIYRATDRQYAPGANALITLASEDGGRAAVVLESSR